MLYKLSKGVDKLFNNDSCFVISSVMLITLVITIVP